MHSQNKNSIPSTLRESERKQIDRNNKFIGQVLKHEMKLQIFRNNQGPQPQKYTKNKYVKGLLLKMGIL